MGQQTEFINKIAPIIREKAFERGYKFPSAIIAQACLESAYGGSLLASKYNNYFGLKCGSSWGGASVNMTTKEEYTTGALTTIRDNFRVYGTMESGIDGYFDFIQAKRYSNLKEAQNSYHYLMLIKSDGYATSSNYVDNVYAVVNKYDLLRYDLLGNLTLIKSDDYATSSNYVNNGYAVANKYDLLRYDMLDDMTLDAELRDAIGTIADYVIKGYFGNGHETRKDNVYKMVRIAVNNKIYGSYN